jgi:predicted XRE-type DNA-binding protein
VTSKSVASDTAKSSPPAPRSRTKRANAQKAVFERSSGNVYLDLGFPPAEAESLLMRSRLMLMVDTVIRERQLTQTRAARLFGVSQPRVSDVIRGRVERFTIDALVEMLAKAGVRLEIAPVP